MFAYVQGTDLEGVAEMLEARLDAPVAERTWIAKDVWVVNQQLPLEAGAKPGELPEWDLGLNLALPAKRTRPAEDRAHRGVGAGGASSAATRGLMRSARSRNVSAAAALPALR